MELILREKVPAAYPGIAGQSKRSDSRAFERRGAGAAGEPGEPLDARPGTCLPAGSVRPTCLRCLRPSSFCYCEALPAIPCRTRVIILQHPREERRAICSAHMASLALPGSEIHRGLRFDQHPRVQELASQPGAALLYPGPEAVPAGALAGRPPAVLLAVDGTWHQAAKMVRNSRILASLPRVTVTVGEPSAYRELRREPAPHCLSTIEALALALGALERDPLRFEPMRRVFRQVVDQQLACAADARRRPRHRRTGATSTPPASGAER